MKREKLVGHIKAPDVGVMAGLGFQKGAITATPYSSTPGPETEAAQSWQNAYEPTLAIVCLYRYELLRKGHLSFSGDE